jgi:hypothetical protein
LEGKTELKNIFIAVCFTLNIRLLLLLVFRKMNLNQAMRKFQLFIFVFMIFFAQNVYCKQSNALQKLSFQSSLTNELSFESNKFHIDVVGEPPTGQVVSNVVPVTSTLFSNSEKLKALNWKITTSSAKINLNLSIHQTSVFTRYSSAFMQIYLKTACFRL